jgi:hypothetical protein
MFVSPSPQEIWGSSTRHRRCRQPLNEIEIHNVGTSKDLLEPAGTQSRLIEYRTLVVIRSRLSLGFCSLWCNICMEACLVATAQISCGTKYLESPVESSVESTIL